MHISRLDSMLISRLVSTLISRPMQHFVTDIFALHFSISRPGFSLVALEIATEILARASIPQLGSSFFALSYRDSDSRSSLQYIATRMLISQLISTLISRLNSTPILRLDFDAQFAVRLYAHFAARLRRSICGSTSTLISWLDLDAHFTARLNAHFKARLDAQVKTRLDAHFAA
jgi:hypothetical protein